MVSETHLQIPFSSKRISSVVPGKDRGENEIHQLRNMDLAMKLHYIKGVYFFDSHAVQGVSVKDLKDAMFPLLDLYVTAAGRIRRSSETGRPMIKCNDAGVRILEAHCDKTMDEWVAELNKGGANNCFRDDGFCYSHVLGPDLGFSPLVFFQFTWFKCGGLAVGLSWAHILGDPLSTHMFINTWSRIMAGYMPPHPTDHVSKSQSPELPNPMVFKKPFSTKEIDKPVGDHWLLSTTNNLKMETHSFQLTAKNLDRLMSSIGGGNQTSKITSFDVLSSVIWKSLSRIREGLGYSPKMVATICHNGNKNNNTHEMEKEMPNNGMVIGTVEAANLLTSIAEADVLELATLISENRVDENDRIEGMIGREDGNGDYVVYGANLTFVNLEGANIYDLEVKGKRPFFANYSIDGVGDEGVVLVLPGPKYGKEEGSYGRTVTVVLPEDEVSHLRNEMRRDWGIEEVDN
ncbi:hypothetical protein FNV43_RR12433 [Rhamnella rubrinervis]|uniref:Uncharacterized protein n=1 Tax=Rhamnella rubrinervis TaxID=2594499 RepID=A0A8K0H8D5_9ROSA|nr:hypothetical protein FNV43_RR12433 [Rhamnella rubrinervis]